MFIYCSSTDSTVHPEPSDNQTDIPFNISWFDVCMLPFISFSLIVVFALLLKYAVLNVVIVSFLLASTVAFLSVHFNVSMYLIPKGCNAIDGIIKLYYWFIFINDFDSKCFCIIFESFSQRKP